MSSPPIAEALRQRVRTGGAEPLITYYDLDSGERTELSGVSLANWVDKTSNLINDELLVEPGTAIELTLATSHPGHWVTLIWELACWQVGCPVSINGALAGSVDVTGPGHDRAKAPDSETVVCNLHPLGLPGPDPAPALDYNTEVRGQGDQYAATRQPDSAPAWADGVRQLDQSALTAHPDDRGGRRLIRPEDPWATVRAALIRPLLLGGSSVVVVGAPSPGQLDALRSVERAD